MENLTAIKRFLKCHRHRLLLAVVIGCAAFLRYGGFDRPLDAHPDQPRILSWMNRAEIDGYLKNTVYPGGFFRLFVQFKRVVSPVITASQEWDYRMGRTDRPLPPQGVNLQVGRHFNVWLAAATCLLIYLCAATITGSVWAGLLAATLFAFIPDHVIHAHYVQTDIAMVFTLTLALYLWAQYAQRRTGWIFMLAALATGYAAGTKYTLLCLAPLGWIFACYPARPDASGTPGAIHWRRVVLLLCCATILFAAGFALASPEVMDWHAFHKGLQWQGQRVYGEGVTILGQARGTPLVKLRAHWQALRETALFNIGGAGLLVGAAGLLLAGMPAHRRFWPILIFFPAVYAYYFLVKAPWVRAQEFMNFLPGWTMLAALAIHYPWRQGAPAKNHVYRAAALVLLAAMALPILRAGMLASSQFTWSDTRKLANHWMQRHLPASTAMGVERYTDSAHDDVCQTARFIHKVETAGDFAALASEFDFILRNPISRGRGICHPVTGLRYPKYQTAFEAFTNQATPLRAWGMLPPHTLKSPFASPDLELWGTARPHAGMDLRIPLGQPAFVSYTGRETFFPAGRELGSREVLLVDKYPRQCAFGGPRAAAAPVFLVLNTLERPAASRVRGFGHRIRSDLTPYQAAVLPLRRRVWQPRLTVFEIITASAEPEPHITYIPLLLRPAFDALDAATILHQTGHTHAALDVLLAAPASDAGGKDLAALMYPLATANADWVLARKWADPAEALRACLRQALAMPPDQLSINGINGRYYDQCARIRLTRAGVCHPLTINPADARPPDDLPALPAGTTWEFPARLARGFYTIAAAIQIQPCPDTLPAAPTDFTVFDHTGRVIVQGARQSMPDEFTEVQFNVSAGRETAAWLHITATTPMALKYRNLEIRWSLHDRIRALYNDLTAARAMHYLHDGDADAALGVLDQAALPCWNDLALKRLTLQALQASGADVEHIMSAARAILALAPDYWPALEMVQPDIARTRPANLANPVRFPPLLALVGMRKPGAPASALELIFEAVDDELPPLAAVIHRRRRGRWREQMRLPITPANRRLHQGERITIQFDPAGLADAGTVQEADIGISVQANVRWSPGTLQPAGRPDTVIPISEFMHAD